MEGTYKCLCDSGYKLSSDEKSCHGNVILFVFFIALLLTLIVDIWGIRELIKSLKKKIKFF